VQVVDALVRHFLRFYDDERAMPVVWHQCLLCFVQRYKAELGDTDRAALRKLVAAQHHYQARRRCRRLEKKSTFGGAAAALRARARSRAPLPPLPPCSAAC